MSLFRRSRDKRPEQPTAVPGSSTFPGGGQWGEIPLPSASSATVLGLPAASRSVGLISNAVAQMAPLESWTPDGYIDPNTPTILVRPNVSYTAFDFLQQAVAQAIMHGNHLSIPADFDAAGYPQQLVPVPTGMWLARYDAAGYLVYDLNGETYSREQVFHVRTGATPNQPMGIGVVTQFRRSIGAALDQQNFAADTYRSGSVPVGELKLELPEATQEQADAVLDLWMTNHSGGRAPSVTDQRMSFTPFTWTPEDLQFLQARQFTIGEIAYMFGLDPTDLGAAMQGSSMTYSNIESRQVQRIVDSYAPWMIRFEQEFSDLIPGENTARFCPDRLLRTDSKTRSEVHEINIRTGVESVDEARKAEGLHPLPKKPEPQPVPAELGSGDGNGEALPVMEEA